LPFCGGITVTTCAPIVDRMARTLPWGTVIAAPIGLGISSTGWGNSGPQSWRAVHKFGANPTLTTGAVETVWPGTGSIPRPAAPVTLQAVSGSTGDSAGSSGALTVTVQGLDKNWREIEETVTLTGQAATTFTSTGWRRVNRAFVATVGTYGTNIGAVSISTGGGSTYALIPAGDGQTLQSAYTVPEGYAAHVTQYTISADGPTKQNTAGGLQADVVQTPPGGARRVVERHYVPSKSGAMTRQLQVPLRFAARTDLEIAARTESTGVSAAASFDLILEPTS